MNTSDQRTEDRPQTTDKNIRPRRPSSVVWKWVSPFGNPRIKARSRLPMAYRSVPRPSSPLSAKASTRYPYDTSSLSLSMARADDRRRTTEHRSTDPCAVMRHPSPAPANSSASRRNQKTFASHVRDGLRSSHPSPMHHSPAPDLVDRSGKTRNIIRLDRTPAPCGTEPDDRTHSLFTMSKNWLAEQAKAPAEPRSAANSYGRTIRKTRRIGDR